MWRWSERLLGWEYWVWVEPGEDPDFPEGAWDVWTLGLRPLREGQRGWEWFLDYRTPADYREDGWWLWWAMGYGAWADGWWLWRHGRWEWWTAGVYSDLPGWDDPGWQVWVRGGDGGGDGGHGWVQDRWEPA